MVYDVKSHHVTVEFTRSKEEALRVFQQLVTKEKAVFALYESGIRIRIL